MQGSCNALPPAQYLPVTHAVPAVELPPAGQAYPGAAVQAIAFAAPPAHHDPAGQIDPVEVEVWAGQYHPEAAGKFVY